MITWVVTVLPYIIYFIVGVILEDGTRKSVEVYNNDKDWAPANCHLTDFIRQLRKA